MSNIDPLVTKYFNSFDNHSGQTIKSLSKNEELYLFRQWKNKGNKEALDKLLLANLKFVVRCANKYIAQCDGKAITINDLIQAGNEGLMQAVYHFKTSKRVRFITLAVWWINAYIRNFIYANISTVHIPLNNTTRSLINYRKSIFDITNSKDSDALKKWEKKIQRKYHVTKNHMKDEEKKIQSILTQRSFDRPVLGCDGAETNFYNQYHDSQLNTECLVENKNKQETMKKLVKKSLKKLKKRDRDIICMRWLSDDDKQPRLSDVADKYNLSRQRIQQIEQRLMKEMKENLKQDKNIVLEVLR